MPKKDFFEKREEELLEDLMVLEGYIKNFWEILPVPVCITSPLFIILETGAAFNHLFGYEKDKLVGDFLDILFVENEDFKRFSEKLSKEKRVSDFEVALQTKKRRKLSILISAICREDEKGRIVGYLLSFVNVTVIRKAERELREKVEELEKINKLMVGRELKMVELKKTIKELEQKKKGR